MRAGGDAEARPRRVDPARIEAELRALWEDVEGDEAAPNVRSSALNLVAVCEAETGPRDFADVVARIVADHPCRVFQVLAEPGRASADLSAAVSAHCHRPLGSDRQICCEQIVLTARGAAVEDLPGTLLPLLLADLPVVVWWLGEPPLAEERFARLARVADRLLVDTSQSPDGVATLAALHAWLQQARHRVTAGDLNWRRLTRWRELVAGVFDPPPQRAALQAIEAINIETAVAAGSGGQVQALYLVGWLASRLGWSVRQATARAGRGFRVEMDAGTHAVRVHVEPAESFAFRLVASEGSFSAAVCAGPGQAAAQVRVEAAGEVQKLAESVHVPPLADLMMREIEMGADPVYGAALEIAGELAALWRPA